MLNALILTACADLTDKLSRCFCSGYDLSYGRCSSGPLPVSCNLAIIGSDQFNSSDTEGVEKTLVDKMIAECERLGIPV